VRFTERLALSVCGAGFLSPSARLQTAACAKPVAAAFGALPFAAWRLFFVIVHVAFAFQRG
jgi:hypothetical protein